MSEPKFQLYSRIDYYQELTDCANAAQPGEAITLMTMVYDITIPAVSSLMDALCGAAARGVTITMIMDAYSFLLSEQDKPGPLLLRGRIELERLSEPFRSAYDKLERLRSNGGKYHIINRPKRPFMYPKAGRSHIKLALVNDRVFIGGCNLEETEGLDMMASWRDAATASWLRQTVDKIVNAGSVKDALDKRDVSHDINHSMDMFIDCGVSRQSIILERAHRLIDEAKETVFMTCQYFPGGATGQHLLSAHKRGVKVRVIYSPPDVHGKEAIGHHIHNLSERLRLPPAFFMEQLPPSAPKLHAKIIATESAVMIGSHNYVAAGVIFGTAEIALLRRDAALASEIRQHILRQIVPFMQG